MQETPPFEVCFNHLSLLATNSEEGFENFFGAISGMIHLYNESFRNASVCLHFEGESIGNHKICEGYTVSDFCKRLDIEYPDVYEVFLSFITDTPSKSGITNEIRYLGEHGNYSFEGWRDKNIIIHYFALSSNCYLLSLPYAGWNKNKIPCYKDSKKTTQTIDNIFSLDCGKFFVDEIAARKADEEIQRVYRLESGTFFIYFNDHNPPHVHYKSTEDNCSLIINDSSLLCGNLSAPSKRSVTNFVTENKEKMMKAWNRICS